MVCFYLDCVRENSPLIFYLLIGYFIKTRIFRKYSFYLCKVTIKTSNILLFLELLKLVGGFSSDLQRVLVTKVVFMRERNKTKKRFGVSFLFSNRWNNWSPQYLTRVIYKSLGLATWWRRCMSRARGGGWIDTVRLFRLHSPAVTCGICAAHVYFARVHNLTGLGFIFDPKRPTQVQI